MIQHPAQPAAIDGDHPLKKAFAGAREAILLAQRFMAEHAGAHHRRQGQRHHRGDQDRHRQGNGELAEQAAHDIAHKQQRDQHRNQREGQRDNGKANLSGPFQGGGQRLFAFLDIARDVFNHHDGVIDHKAGGDGQSHQRQVVNRKIEEHHHREGADQRQRYGNAGNNRRRNVAQKDVDNHHHQGDGQHQFKLGIADRRADIGGAVGKHLHFNRFRQAFGELRQHLADAVGGRDNIRPRLALDVHDDRPLIVGPCSEPAVFSALFHGGNVAEANRRAVLPGDNQAAIILRRLHLIVGGEGNRPRRAVEATLRRIDVSAGNRGAYRFAGQAEGGDGLGVELDAYRRALPARQSHQPDAGNLGDFLRHAGLDHIFDLGHRHGGRGDREGHNRRIGGIHFAVDRRVRQVRGQQVGGGVDGRLHFLLSDVQRQR